MKRFLAFTGITLAACLAAQAQADDLKLRGPQKENLTHEPLLVTLKLDGPSLSLPATDKTDSATLRFEVKPALKPRSGIKPLVVEGKVEPESGTIRSRRYDLLEWFQFPAEGTFTVHAVLESSGKLWKSEAATFTIRRPAKGDKEWAPVDRLHHLPWCSYLTDAFCGDTFDLVKQWPDSQLAKYCHYWNGLHLQHKKEPAKAAESFQIALKYPSFDFGPAARLGLVETLHATGKLGEARAALQPFFEKTETAELATDSEMARAHALTRLLDAK